MYVRRVRSIGVGMLGYAFRGKAHANAYRKLAYMTWPPPLLPRLVSISGRGAEAVAEAEAEAAQRYGFESHSTDWRETVADLRRSPRDARSGPRRRLRGRLPRGRGLRRDLPLRRLRRPRADRVPLALGCPS